MDIYYLKRWREEAKKRYRIRKYYNYFMVFWASEGYNVGGPHKDLEKHSTLKDAIVECNAYRRGFIYNKLQRIKAERY